MKSIEKYSDFELLSELRKRGRFTNAGTNSKIFEDLPSSQGWKIIVTRGVSSKKGECSRCRKLFPSREFPHYQSRVSKSGFLQRSNAVCKKCSKKHKKELKVATSNIDVGPKPSKGDMCKHCERKWEGNWHRHHQGTKFIGWLCGHCNMSFSDHRNKEVMDKRKIAQ